MYARSPAPPAPLWSAATSAAVILAALVVVTVAAARHSSRRSRSTARPHRGAPVLVMTGAGDPAFVKNFNPFTATVYRPDSSCAGHLRRLMVSPEGGKPTQPWVARQWKWSTATRP